LVEIGYEYGDMEIKFHNKNLKYNLSNEIGFKRYRINNSDYNYLNFTIKNNIDKTANYMIR